MSSSCSFHTAARLESRLGLGKAMVWARFQIRGASDRPPPHEPVQPCGFVSSSVILSISSICSVLYSPVPFLPARTDHHVIDILAKQLCIGKRLRVFITAYIPLTRTPAVRNLFHFHARTRATVAVMKRFARGKNLSTRSAEGV